MRLPAGARLGPYHVLGSPPSGISRVRGCEARKVWVFARRYRDIIDDREAYGSVRRAESGGGCREEAKAAGAGMLGAWKMKCDTSCARRCRNAHSERRSWAPESPNVSPPLRADRRPSRVARRRRDRGGVRFVIVLDTNLLSALMRSTPEAVVVDWLDRQPADSVWLTSITVFEARFGLAVSAKRAAPQRP